MITGPMFSGKSEELIRRLTRARIARQRVACFKPDIDLRYHRTAIASHGSHTHDAAIVTPTTDSLKAELFESGRVHQVDVIGLDEVQFFDSGITHLAMELVHLGKRVILAGLDTTFANEPFGPVPNLMALADEVTKLSAVCMVCGAPAIHTQRLGQSQQLVVAAPQASTKPAAALTSNPSPTNTTPSNSTCSPSDKPVPPDVGRQIMIPTNGRRKQSILPRQVKKACERPRHAQWARPAGQVCQSLVLTHHLHHILTQRQ
jgi:thymidine kinase